MKVLDVNVWLAASWARHAAHALVKAWFDKEEDSLALCRVTQMALLRLISNPAVTGKDVLSRRAAWETVERLMADPRVRLLEEPDGLETLWKAFSRRDDASHLLWTDDYLAAFAGASGLELVTLDGGFLLRYPSVHVTCLP